jgi:hypothetical protein
MFRFTKLAATGLMLGTSTFFLVGCESSNRSSTGSSNMDASQASMRSSATTQPMKMTAGVTCEKCKVTYVRVPYSVPGYEGPRVVGYRSEKATECPDCRKHAMAYLNNGTPLPADACKECGGKMEIAEPR